MNRWTEDSGGTKAKKFVKVGPAKTVPFARSLYPGHRKLLPVRFQWQKIRNACNFSKGVWPCTYVKKCLSLHNTGGTTTPGGRDFRGSRKATLPSIKMFTKRYGGQYGPKWPIREGREGHHAIGRVNFSKLLVQRYLDSRGEEGFSFACGKATYTSIKMFTILGWKNRPRC